MSGKGTAKTKRKAATTPASKENLHRTHNHDKNVRTEAPTPRSGHETRLANKEKKKADTPQAGKNDNVAKLERKTGK